MYLGQVRTLRKFIFNNLNTLFDSLFLDTLDAEINQEKVLTAITNTKREEENNVFDKDFIDLNIYTIKSLNNNVHDTQVQNVFNVFNSRYIKDVDLDTSFYIDKIEVINDLKEINYFKTNLRIFIGEVR